MSLFSDNVLPGKTGKIFRTGAQEPAELHKIGERILKLKGVHDVAINHDVFPAEFTIHSNDFSIVSVDDIEQEALKCGFHLIPKSDWE